MIIGSFSNEEGDGNKSFQNGNGLVTKNKNFARASLFFCTFFYRHCTTRTWKYLISRHGGRKQATKVFLFLNLSEVSKKSTPGNHLQLKFSANRNLRNKVWINTALSIDAKKFTTAPLNNSGGFLNFWWRGGEGRRGRGWVHLLHCLILIATFSPLDISC